MKLIEQVFERIGRIDHETIEENMFFNRYLTLNPLVELKYGAEYSMAYFSVGVFTHDSEDRKFVDDEELSDAQLEYLIELLDKYIADHGLSS